MAGYMLDEEGEEEYGARLKQLDDSVEANPEDPSLHFDLGVLLWEKGGESKEIKEKSAEHFVISAKLNPQNAAAFRYLGHYYKNQTSSGDYLQRAIKCYQRGISLNPDDGECGESLCDLLDQLGKESLEVAVCNEACEKSARAFWAFRRLGFLHLHHSRCSDAVHSLQHAIRGFPTSPDLWEALGIAYQRLGMFTAATKSYGRVIELEDTRIFALVESGNIFLMLGSFRKGIEQFQRALEISPQNMSANYGLASGLLSLAKECMNLGAFRWGASLLEDAAKVADATAHFSGNVSCIWKLHGDIQVAYAKCFPWMEGVHSAESTVESFDASVVSWKRTCHAAAMCARRSYQRALHLAPWQANLYIDIAVTLDLVSSMTESSEHDLCPWQLSEKMALGALLLEGGNSEFWVALGYLSDHGAMKQHALIRGLQLDVSSAVAWAYLGKLYREEGEKKLARQAFDCSRSVDPSFALPWAGMAADSYSRQSEIDEAFESCLRSAQIFPLAEFQVGLAKLALVSGHLTSPQVFAAIQQAVLHVPHYPESHNLKGLVCEARGDYQAAVTSYRLARYAMNLASVNASKSCLRDIGVNLARSFCMAGYAADAVQECENMNKEGILDAEGLQIYAFSLWQLGKTDLALSVASNLAAIVPSMEQTSAAASVSFICRLLYYISGLESAIARISKMPKELFQSSKVSFILSAIHALDQSNQLESAVLSSRYSVVSPEDISAMHYLIALSKLLKNGSEFSLGFQSGINHLKRALHKYPNSKLIRNLLGYLLLSVGEWKETHVASRCCMINSPCSSNVIGLKSGREILGAGSVACYAIGTKNPKYSFPTCGYQCENGPGIIIELQKYLRQQPWNHNARYLLILNIFQRAREERFPQHLCAVLRRLINVAFSSMLCSRESLLYRYQKFQLLLCHAEINLQVGNQVDSIKLARRAVSLLLPNNYLFFGHLLLCRAYATKGNYINLQEEYNKCLEIRTDYHIGWACLKIMESQYDIQTELNILELCFEECSMDNKNSWNMWMAANNLVLGLVSSWNQELLSAEESFRQACSLAGDDSCLFLCHGAVCMKLARESRSSEFLSLAIRSLTRAHANAIIPLPIVSLLLAQAEGSLGSKQKWMKNLRLEWYSWPPEMRHAEIFFQMHLLARLSESESGYDTSSCVEFCQSPQKWVLRAIHTNPSRWRYWKVLQNLGE